MALSRPRSRRTILRSVLLLAVLAGCDGGLFDPFAAGANVPAVGMSPGHFGFAITARRWTSDQSWAPDLSTEPLRVGLAVAGYAGGKGQLTIAGGDGVVVLARDLAGNLAEGNEIVVHGQPPFRIRIVAESYTGIISLGVDASATAGAASR